jgi:hypothetical protein
MAKKTIKKVSFLVERGIRINGESIFPAKGKAKPVIVQLPEMLAKELVHASKGQIVEQAANTKVAAESTDDDLDAAFGPEDESE